MSQFFVALKASLPTWAGGVKGGLSAEDKALVKSILPTPAQQELFGRMPPNDQSHGIAVARTLQQAGHDDPRLSADDLETRDGCGPQCGDRLAIRKAQEDRDAN